MSFPHTIFIATILSLSCLSSSAQTPGSVVSTAAAATAGLSTATTLLKPSLDGVEQTVSSLRLDRWKKGSVREEAGDNIAAIVRDIKTNLPPLLMTADASPQLVSKVLPVLRNIDALYDVLLRVNEAARVAAPADQVTQIDQALNSLQKARLALDDSLQDAASLAEKRAIDLQATVDAQASVKCPVLPTPKAPVCAPLPARRVRRKPTPPAATAPATQPSATATPKPQN